VFGRCGPLRGMSKRQGVVWGDLLSSAAANDLGSAVQSVLWAFEIAQSPQHLNVEALVHAIGAALQSAEPQRMMVGSLTLLAALNSEVCSSSVPLLAGDSVYAGLSSALAAGSPMVVAAAARSLCALMGAVTNQGLREERQERLTRLRKLAPQLRVAVEAHPKALLVQEAFAEGCCALLVGDQPALGGHVSTLWALLWPLVVHPRDEVASAAMLSICRLTWLARAPVSSGVRGTAPQDQPSVPGAEEAAATACTEFREVFKVLEVSVKQGAATAATQMAQLQCTRLLALLQGLVRFGHSALQAMGRRDRGGCPDGAVIVLPIAQLLGTVDAVVMAVFRDSGVAARVLGEERGSARIMATVLAGTLSLAATIAEVGGAALLPHASQVRRLLEILTEVSPATHWRHCKATCGLMLAVAQSAPAVLLQKKLLARLVAYVLAMMQPMERAGCKVPVGAPSKLGGMTAPSRRKRKPAEAFGAGAGSAALDGSASTGSGQASQDMFPSACQVLARIVTLGAPLLSPPQVASIAEQVIRTLWLGLVAPLPDRTAAASSDGDPEKLASVVAIYQELCRDTPSVLALLDVMQSLHQTPRPCVTPLAPSLRDAFAALLNVITAAHQRRVAGNLHRVGRPCSTETSAVASLLPDLSVSVRAMQIRDTFLAAASWPTHTALGAGQEGMTAGISISWPEVSAAFGQQADAAMAEPSEPMLEAHTEAAEPLAAEADTRSPADVPPAMTTPDVDQPAAAAAASAEAAAAEAPAAASADATIAGAPAAAPAEATVVETPVASSADATVAEASASPAPQVPPSEQPAGEDAAKAGSVPERASAAADVGAQLAAADGPAGQGGACNDQPVPTAPQVQSAAAGADGTEKQATQAPAGLDSMQKELTTDSGLSAANLPDLSSTLELFPDGSDASPIPSLCMDSPSDECP